MLLSALLSLKSFRLRWPAAMRYFSVFLWVTVAGEAFANAWPEGLHQVWNYSINNLWIYNALLPVRHLLLLVYFYELLDSAMIRKIIRWSVLPFLAFALVNYFFMQGPHAINSYTMILANLITVFLTVVFFDRLLNHEPVIRLSRASEVWIAIGTFIYHSGALPVFIYMNYLIARNQGLASSLLTINDILNVLMYSFYLIAFLCKPHFQKQAP